LTKTWEKTFTKTWKSIAHFEKREVKSWKKSSPLQKEARACERMKAYEKLAIELADRKSQEEQLSFISSYIGTAIGIIGDKK